MGYRTLLEKILARERIEQVALRKRMAEKLALVNDGGSDDIPVINKGNLSTIVSGKQFKITEMTARRILMTINSLRFKKSKPYKFRDVFESERLLFSPKENE